MTKDEICGLLRQIHDVLAMQSETNFVPQQPTTQEYAMGYAEGFNDACKPKQGGEDYRAMYLKVRDELSELQQRTWVRLTDREIEECWDGDLSPYQMQCIREIEAKLRELNA
jgi:hypothetical protein